MKWEAIASLVNDRWYISDMTMALEMSKGNKALCGQSGHNQFDVCVLWGGTMMERKHTSQRDFRYGKKSKFRRGWR